MVYTKSRLENALKVFRQSATYRKRRGLNDTNLNRYPNHQLRQTTKTLRSRNFQGWKFAEVQNDSDEDEYCPDEERRRSMAERKKRKDANLKRKAAEANEEQKTAKKRKGEELLHRNGETGFVVLRLTTQKGLEKLEELSRGRKTRPEYFDRTSAGSTRESSERRSNDGSPRKRTRSCFDWVTEDDVDVDDVGDTEHNLDNARGDHRTQATTALRSGRVLKKAVENPFNNDNDDSGFVSLPEKADTKIDNRQQNRLRPALPLTSRSTNLIGNSIDQPIEIDTSDEDDKRLEVASHTTKQTGDNVSSRQIKTEREQIHATSMVSRFNAPRLVDGQSQFRYEPDFMQVKTSYIHPIDFTLVPGKNKPPYCDFCTDWTMGILGRGTFTTSAKRDPKDPTRLVLWSENRDGFAPTKMCIKCSLGRLLIMRCHRPQHQSTKKSPTNGSTPIFTRIHDDRFSKAEQDSYLDHLFPESRRSELRGCKQGPFPSCSLCLHAATWKCCKWQERDRGNRPCKIPDLAQQAKAAASGVVSLSSSSSSPVRGKSSSAAHLPLSASSGEHRQQTKPEVISLLDPSEEESNPTPKPVASSKAVTASSPLPTKLQTTFRDTVPTLKSPARGHRSNPEVNPRLNSLSTPTPTQTSTLTSRPSQPLRPPIQGCGLHLCTPCHTFLTRTSTCNGLLDRVKVQKHLQGKKHGGRADVDWLFGGSLLEREVERECRKARRRR